MIPYMEKFRKVVVVPLQNIINYIQADGETVIYILSQYIVMKILISKLSNVF